MPAVSSVHHRNGSLTRPRNLSRRGRYWENGAANPHDYYAFSIGTGLEAIMTGDGKWKLHLPHGYRDVVKPGNDGERGTTRTSRIEMTLFDMESDPMEQINVIEDHPEIAERLRAYAEDHRKKYPNSNVETR